MVRPERGAQQPRLGSWPAFESSAGQECIDLAFSSGVFLDPWQQLVLEVSLAERPGGGWATFETAVVVCRQNGKGEITLARQLFGLFLLNSGLQVHTAHEFKAAADAFRRIMEVIESNPDLDRRVAKVNRSHGDEGVELKSGAKLRFFARTTGSGRAFSGDTVYLDEAFNVPESVTRALVPVMLTRSQSQLWWTSSSVDQKQHQNGRMLAKVRRRALAGADPTLAYFEWSADDARYRREDGGVDYDKAAADERAVAEANPSLNLPRENAPTTAAFAKARGAMTAQGFAVEHLGIGDWPTDEADRERVIAADVWSEAAVEVHQEVRDGVELWVGEHATMRDPMVLAIDTSPGLHPTTSVGAAGWNDQGRPLLEVIEHRAGTGWVVDRVVDIVHRHDPAAVVIDPAGAAGAFIEQLASAGIEVVKLTTREAAAAFGLFHSDATAGRAAHLDDPVLAAALDVADTRPLADAMAWSRRSSSDDISSLVAVTNARYGLEIYGRPLAVPAPVQSMSTASTGTSSSDVMTIGF